MIRELSQAQIDMKALIDEERAIYNEEREKLEEDMKRVGRVAEAKVRLIRSKLLTLYDGDLDVGRELGIEEVIDRISVRLDT